RSLAVTPLRFAITSPPSGCEGDLHPRVVEHARHTKKGLRKIPRSPPERRTQTTNSTAGGRGRTALTGKVPHGGQSTDGGRRRHAADHRHRADPDARAGGSSGASSASSTRTGAGGRGGRPARSRSSTQFLGDRRAS